MAGRSRRDRRAPKDAPAAQATAVEARPTRAWLAPPLLAAFFLALLPRLVLLAQLRDHPLLQPEGDLDSAVYVRLAQRAAGGDWALGPEAYFVSPLYLYFLAAMLRLFGPGLIAAQLVQVALGAAAAALVAATAHLLFGRRAAWIAGALAALTGLFAFNEVLLLQSSLDPCLASAALLLLARAVLAGNIATWLAAGLGFGALCANRPNTLLAVLALALVHVITRRNRRAVLEAGALLLGLVLATAPFTLRNRLVTGEWVWLTSHGGLNFYIGNHAEADGRYRSVEGIAPSIEGQATSAKALAEASLGRPLRASEVSSYWYSLALGWIRDHPWQALRLHVRKLLLALSATDLALNYSFSYYRLDEPTVLRWLFAGPALLVPLGLLGLVVGPQRPLDRAPAAWLAFVPAYALSVSIFFVASRYRLPLLVGLCITAGAALARLSAWAGEGRARALGASAIALSALTVLTLLPLAPDEGRVNERTERIVRFIRDGQPEEARRLLATTEPTHPTPGLLHYRVGRAFQDRGELGEAIGAFERAIAATPGGGEPVVRLSLGQALASAGRAVEAVPHLRAARDAGVSPALAGYELARALADGGSDDEARVELRKLTLPPGAPSGARLAIGQLALRLREEPLALATLREAVSLDPAFAPARAALALALEEAGRRSEAIEQLEEACRLDPASASARFNLAVLLVRSARPAEARRLLDEALRLEPGHQAVRRLRAEIEQAR